MSEADPPPLAQLCVLIADDLEDVTHSAEGEATIYARGAVAFARVGPSWLEVHLPGDIAEAALRTPDTVDAAERDWIRFAPTGSERHVFDRAEAWFRTAWRHAAPRPSTADRRT